MIAPGATLTPSTAADINDFHCSHGHMHKDLLRKAAKQVEANLRGQLVPCQECSDAKGISKLVKPLTHTRAVKPTERCFVDLAGPKSVRSPGGKEYMMLVEMIFCDSPRGYFFSVLKTRQPCIF